MLCAALERSFLSPPVPRPKAGFNPLLLEIADMPRPVLLHPFLNHDPGEPLPPNSIGDALDAASAALWLLADLFVAPVVQCETLNSDEARRGMFNQLATIANTLEVLSDRIGTSSIND